MNFLPLFFPPLPLWMGRHQQISRTTISVFPSRKVPRTLRRIHDLRLRAVEMVMPLLKARISGFLVTTTQLLPFTANPTTVRQYFSSTATKQFNQYHHQACFQLLFIYLLFLLFLF